MQKRWVASTSNAYTNRRCMLCLVPMSFLVSCAGFVPVLHCSGRSAECLRGVLHFCLVSLLPVRMNGTGRWCSFQFLSIRWLCGIRWEQCLYDNRCDISGIDEVPYLISIATDSMDDCRDMMPGKEQVEHSTIPAMNQSLPVRLMRNLTAGALVYIRYMVVMLCAYISFRYLR